MATQDAWLKIKGDSAALQKVLNAIHSNGIEISNLRVARSLDHSAYHINLVIEGSAGLETFSSSISLLPEVDKFELPKMPAKAKLSSSPVGCW